VKQTEKNKAENIVNKIVPQALPISANTAPPSLSKISLDKVIYAFVF